MMSYYWTMKRDILSDTMSPKASIYRFHTAKVKQLIRDRGGMEVVAVALRTTVRTLYRTIGNDSLNGRMQRDLVNFLGVSSGKIGYLATEPSNVSLGAELSTNCLVAP